MTDRSPPMVNIVVFLIISPVILFASSIPLRFVASIIAGSEIGLVAFAFAAPFTLILMVVFVLILFEIRIDFLNLLPALRSSAKPAPPPFLFGVAVATSIMVASTALWWYKAFPPGALLAQGKQIEMRVATVTQAATNDGSVTFYSQQVWLEHLQQEPNLVQPPVKSFPLFAPRWIDEDMEQAKLQKHSQSYAPGNTLKVWALDTLHGPFYERRFNAGSFGALLWWWCAALIIIFTVLYVNLLAKYPQQMELWQDRLKRGLSR